MTQAELDAIPYPPTHVYILESLRPLGVLADRVRRILQLCPDFFVGPGRFLDVGASKGFFSLKAEQGGFAVTALEPDSKALAAWMHCFKGKQLQQTFGHAEPFLLGEFDTVWIGNGPHYLYRENPAWHQKLAMIATGRVVMEGPIGRACKDIAEWERVQEEPDLLMSMRAAGFALKGRFESPSYTPGRAIWSFVKS